MKTPAIPGAIAVFFTAACASAAFAQSAPPAQATAAAPAAQPAVPLQLQVPRQPVQEAPAASDNAIVDAQDSGANTGDDKHGPQVHGSFTTGIGYSKGYGTSTMNAAELDVSGQTDSGRTYDMHLHVIQSNGPGFSPYVGYYGPRYR